MNEKPQRVKITNWTGGENLWDNPVNIQLEDALRCRNQEYRTSGSLEPRKGNSRYNCCAENEILGIKEFKLHGDTFYIVIDKSGEINLFDPSGPTLTSLDTGNSTLDYSYWTFAVLNDCYLVMTNGIDRPKLYDGNEIRDCGEIEFPVFIGNCLKNVTGTPQEVGYSVKISFYDEDTEYETSLSNPTNVVQSERDTPALTLGIGSQITTIPSRFTHYRIYRTRGDGETYYYEKQVVISTVSVTLTANDSDLEELAPDDLAPMPSMPYVCASQGMLWCGGYVEYEEGDVTVVNGDTAIVGSGTGWTKAIIGKYIVIDGDEANKYVIYDVDVSAQTLRTNPEYKGSGASGKSYKIFPDKWRAYHCEKTVVGFPMIEQWPSDHFVEVKYNEDAGMTGIGDLEGSTALFTDRSIYQSAPDNDGYQVARKLKSPTGTCSHRSIAKDGLGNLFFLSKYKLGVWLSSLDGGDYKFVNIGLPILPRLQELDSDKLQYAHAEFVNEKYHLWMATTDAVGTEIGEVCYVYDTRMKAWIESEGPQATSSGSIDGELLIGDEYGYLYKGNTGTNDGANLLTEGERTGTATSGGNSTLSDTGQSWTPTECKGLYVNIVSGTGIGQRRKISANTSAQLTVTVVWTTNPDATSVYAIGAIRFLRRFGWFTLAEPIRTWELAIHQEVQTDGTVSVKAYKNYDTDTTLFTESIDLTKGIDRIKLSMQGPTIAFDLVQDNVDVEFKIYAFILMMNQILNENIIGAIPSQQQEAQSGT